MPIRPCALLSIVTALLTGVSFVPPGARAQSAGTLVAGRNVNMVSGTTLPWGDPYLQRQNEPSGAVSTRNRMHLLVGANDYRTVDLPGLPTDRVVGDAWLGVFKSFDGGLTWRSSLMPGFPQDSSPEGRSSPVFGFESAADPAVRAGTNGLFYYGGIAFNRGENAQGVVFVARFIDLNNREEAVRLPADEPDPIKYIGTVVLHAGSANVFSDKPWMAVDIPRAGAVLSNIDVPENLPGGPKVRQQFPCGNAYMAYTVFDTSSQTAGRSKVLLARSIDCGATWEPPKAISQGQPLNQGTTVAVDPDNGDVYVAWRQFRTDTNPDSILIVKSTDLGRTFGAPVEVARIDAPFDQPTLPNNSVSDFRAFRTNSYPSMAIDGSGRVYVAWSERQGGAAGESRAFVSTSADGRTWAAPAPIDGSSPGHQIMPALAFAGGRLTALWYDLRDDVLGAFGPTPFIADPVLPEPPAPPRHTIDIRAAQAEPSPAPVFSSPAVRVSKYMSTFISTPSGIETLQLDYNPPNLPMFGLKPFIGDYVDVIPSPFFLAGSDGTWHFNTEANPETFFHAVWTDNRRVVPPEDGDWASYTPPGPTGGPSPCVPGRAGMRDQNIFTAPLSHGLVVGTRGNAKPLLDQDGNPVQRTFTVFLENIVPERKGYQLSIVSQPPGGQASFLQFPVQGLPDPLTRIEIALPAFAGAARTAFVTSTDPDATITVAVREVELDATGEVRRDAGGNAIPVAGGLSGIATLNPDPTNPPLLSSALDTETHDPALVSRTIIEWPQLVDPLNPALLNPALLNPALLNPALLNPALLNPALLNPALLNPALLNPALLNPALLNPALLNPALLNPALLNASLTDATWTVQNAGNSASSYVFAPLSNPGLPPGLLSQLLIYRIYRTPAAEGCRLTEEGVHYEIFANILNPELIEPAALESSLLNPALLNATFSLAPDDEIRVTWRVINADGTRVDPDLLNATVVAQAANTGESEPRATLTLTPGDLPGAVVGQAFDFIVGHAGGNGEIRWSIVSGALPPGVNLNTSTGAISGIPAAGGLFRFSVRATDSGSPPQSDEREFVIGVERAVQTIAFDPVPAKVYGDPPFTVSATASSGLPVTFSIVSGPAAIEGNIVTPTGAGTVTIRASQAGNDSYLSAVAELSFTVAKAPQAITFDPLPDRILGEPPFALGASASSGLPVTYQVVSGPATVQGNLVNLTGVGAVVIRASQPGDANYVAAAGVDRSFTVRVVFSGFEPPLGPAGNPNVFGPFSLGSTVPVKWRLEDASGNGVSDVSLIVSLRVAVAGAGTDAAATGSTELRSGGQYVFNWNTAGLVTKTVYVLTLNLRDGSAKTVRVRLK